MKSIDVTQLKPFVSDGWKSIERYGRLIGHLNSNADKRVFVTTYTPPESFKSFGNFVGRRLIYTAAAAQFKNASIVHILDAAYSNLIIPLNHKRVVITCHDTDVWRSVTKINRPVRLQLLKSLSRAAAIVTPSKVVAAELEEFLRDNKFEVPPIRVISNAVDPVFKPSLNKASIRQTMGISTAPTLLYVANTSWPRKKFDFLIDVLVELAGRKFVFNLVHLGPALSMAQDSKLSEVGLKDRWRTFTNLSDQQVCDLYGMVPTAVQLGFLPLIEAGVVDTQYLVADAKSGVSGAGRKAEMHALFAEAADNFRAYGVAGHRHLPEISQGLAGFAGKPVGLTFVPHLTPLIRGIHATLYARLTKNTDLQALFENRYAKEYFVDVMPAGTHPETRSVRGANFCRIAVHRPQGGDTVVVLSVIDNLVKGASGQAVQNMNIMFGLPETMGLEQIPLSP